MDRKRAGADGTADRMTRQAQPMQPDHLLIAEAAAIAARRALLLLARGRRHGPRRRSDLAGEGACGLTNRAAVTIHHALQGLAEVAEQMPAVGGLHGIRCPLPHGIGVGAGAVAGDNLDPFMALEPGGERGRLPVGQEVDDRVALEIDQDGPVALAPAPGPVIHAQHARGRRLRDHGAVDEPQQGVRADRHGQAGSDTRAGLAAESQAKLALNLAEPLRAARRPGGGWAQMFGEGPPRAGGAGTQKAADADQQGRGAALPWQILQPALVPGVNPGGGLAAAGTACRRGLRLGEDRDPVGRRRDPLDREAGRDQRQNALCQGSPVVTASPEDGNLASRPPSLHAKRGRAQS